MTKRLLLLLAPLAMIASATASSWVPPTTASGSSCKSEKFCVALARAKVSSEMDYNTESKTRHCLELWGSFDAPSNVDAVCVTKRFRVTAAQDPNNTNMYKPPATPASPRWGNGEYNAFHDAVAYMEVEKFDLSRHPTFMRTLSLQADVLVAVKRQDKIIPACVMEDFQELLDGISVRTTRLEMTKDRELTVVMDYKRPQTGTVGTFIEAIHALAPDNKDLGGGRWTEGDPFGKYTKFTARFKLAGDQVHKSFRIIFVTESTSRTISMELKDILIAQPGKSNVVYPSPAK